jgi:non-canonical (house-cleaning) NTP pyrophosphatase
LKERATAASLPSEAKKPKMSTEVVVALASQSAIKKEATTQAFSNVFPNGFELKCYATSSDINEQPIGFEETIKGS